MQSRADYDTFIKSKSLRVAEAGFDEIPQLNDILFPFQRDTVRWALRKGRAAIWQDCGLGKTMQSLEWARVVCEKTGGDVLILTPLAVAHQFAIEADRLGTNVSLCREAKDIAGGINITNYERLHLFDADRFVGIVLDESSRLKDHTSATRNTLIEAFEQTPYRLACSATPAPNDFMELGNHSEFLGAMTRSEMLAMFFVHDGGETQKWRLKGHAQHRFWEWLCSWAIYMRKPSDLGYSDDGFVLPPLNIIDHVVPNSDDIAKEAGTLFVYSSARTLNEQRAARRESLSRRVDLAAELANGSDEPWIVWCDLNVESESLARAIPDAVEVRGQDSYEKKEEALIAFANEDIRVLITKPSIAGHGMNFQHCHNVAFVGVSHSYEQWYQAIRRTYRFGQKNEVNCHVIVSEAEGEVVKNLRRKEQDSETMADGMVNATADITKVSIRDDCTLSSEHYEPTDELELPAWIGSARRSVRVMESAVNHRTALFHGDCVDVVGALPDDSIHYSIFSPPFADLYVYSNSERDIGNCKTQQEFFEHFAFLVPELLRVTMPGRLLSFHCMNLPANKSRDGYIGLRDFRGELIRVFVEAGWIYHSEVCIWKDPVTAMQRTKALGLLHKQIRKDACMCRQGIPDYLVTMRKPGDNQERVSNTHESFPVRKWQEYASPIWTDINPSDTLQFRSAREHQDEKHICPLQLTVISRAIELWTNEDDIVLSPFMGIGSEGYIAAQEQRRFIGVELKKSYYQQAVKNIASAHKQQSLFQ